LGGSIDEWKEAQRYCPSHFFEASKRKKCIVNKPLGYNFWGTQVNTNLPTFGKCFKRCIWTPKMSDSISWKLTNNGCYSSKSSCNIEFFDHKKSSMFFLVCKPWATHQCTIFADS
jgi:hypothetical protein